MVTREPGPKLGQDGKPKADRRTGELLFVVQVMALDGTGAEVITVTVAGHLPNVAVGHHVNPVELEAIPWATDGRSGTAYRAKSLDPVPAPKAA